MINLDEKIKQLMEQGQHFNEQSQYVIDLEYKNSKLQEKIDKALERANHACIGTAMFHKQFNDVINILRGED